MLYHTGNYDQTIALPVLGTSGILPTVYYPFNDSGNTFCVVEKSNNYCLANIHCYIIMDLCYVGVFVLGSGWKQQQAALLFFDTDVTRLAYVRLIHGPQAEHFKGQHGWDIAY